jgi:hypothetical protein
MNVFDVLLDVCWVDKNVIHICHGASVSKLTQDLIHESLESSWCIPKPEGHDMKDISTIGSYKCSFFLVTFQDRDLIVSTIEVQFEEYLCLTQRL